MRASNISSKMYDRYIQHVQDQKRITELAQRDKYKQQDQEKSEALEQ